MKFIKVKFSVIFLFTLGISTMQAQEVIPAAGGEASGSGGTSSYSVGQTVYATSISTSGSVAQGVQQPYEISVVISIEEGVGINLVVSAYPNPTTDFLLLTVSGEIHYEYYAKVFDVNGKLVGSEKITQPETKIDMLSLMQGAYFLKVVQDDKEMKTFKIIKQ